MCRFGVRVPVGSQNTTRMDKSLYIAVEYDEYYNGVIIDDMDDYLRNWNQVMHTKYKTMEEFNEGEEWRAIYKIEP